MTHEEEVPSASGSSKGSDDVSGPSDPGTLDGLESQGNTKKVQKANCAWSNSVMPLAAV